MLIELIHTVSIITASITTDMDTFAIGGFFIPFGGCLLSVMFVAPKDWEKTKIYSMRRMVCLMGSIFIAAGFVSGSIYSIVISSIFFGFIWIILSDRKKLKQWLHTIILRLKGETNQNLEKPTRDLWMHGINFEKHTIDLGKNDENK